MSNKVEATRALGRPGIFRQVAKATGATKSNDTPGETKSNDKAPTTKSNIEALRDEVAQIEPSKRGGKRSGAGRKRKHASDALRKDAHQQAKRTRVRGMSADSGTSGDVK